jgi:dinuclear metal center YbgI/SA1388 family protein
MTTVADVTAFLDRFAPPDSAADWDNVGLLLGERGSSVLRVLTCLTVTPESAAEAIETSAQLIVSHHPVLFKAVRRLTDATPEGRTLLALARAGVALYSPHTAFDNCGDGINETLARRVGLADLAPLKRGGGAAECKVVVFVPEQDLHSVMDSLFGAGAGRIGNYRECSFRVTGTGTFFGSDAANPAVGQKGRREEVAEHRLEVICPESFVAAVVAAARRAHSYEEPAIDVYPLRARPASSGEGRVGVLSGSTRLAEFAAGVRRELVSGPVQVVGDPDRAVRRVAVVCGAGGSFVGEAVRAGADVLLTGEARFHDYLEAQARGLALVLPGHYATERLGAGELARRIGAEFPGLDAVVSTRESDPVGWA